MLVGVNLLFCSIGVLGNWWCIPEPVLGYPFLAVTLGFLFLFPRP